MNKSRLLFALAITSMQSQAKAPSFDVSVRQEYSYPKGIHWLETYLDSLDSLRKLSEEDATNLLFELARKTPWDDNSFFRLINGPNVRLSALHPETGRDILSTLFDASYFPMLEYVASNPSFVPRQFLPLASFSMILQRDRERRTFDPHYTPLNLSDFSYFIQKTLKEVSALSRCNESSIINNHTVNSKSVRILIDNLETILLMLKHR